MPAAYPLALRRRAVSHYRNTNSTQLETAELFKIGIATLRIYLRRDEQNNLAPKTYQRGRKPVISSIHLKKIGDWVSDKPDIRVKHLCKKYKHYYKKTVSQSMMSRALQSLAITRKKKSLFAQEQLRSDVQKKEHRT